RAWLRLAFRVPVRRHLRLDRHADREGPAPFLFQRALRRVVGLGRLEAWRAFLGRERLILVPACRARQQELRLELRRLVLGWIVIDGPRVANAQIQGLAAAAMRGDLHAGANAIGILGVDVALGKYTGRVGQRVELHRRDLDVGAGEEQPRAALGE